MRNPKAIFLLVCALVFITIAFVLISIWGYRYYFQKENLKPDTSFSLKRNNPIIIKDTVFIDSNYTSHNLTDSINPSRVPADSTSEVLDEKIAKITRLTNEISDIIKTKVITKESETDEPTIARLQKKIDSLRNKNSKVISENIKLYHLLKQLSKAQNLKRKSAKLTTTSATSNENMPTSTPFSVSNLRLAAISVNGNKESDTFWASEAVKLEGTFLVKNTDINSAEIDIVIVQPDGKVLQNPTWESGYFLTANGKKMYSVKLHFNGDNNRMNFSISDNKFQKGIYEMQVFYKGIMLGKTVKILS